MEDLILFTLQAYESAFQAAAARPVCERQAFHGVFGHGFVLNGHRELNYHVNTSLGEGERV